MNTFLCLLPASKGGDVFSGAVSNLGRFCSTFNIFSQGVKVNKTKKQPKISDVLQRFDCSASHRRVSGVLMFPQQYGPQNN